ncbi:MAG: AMP-binding protein, partial [Planctomycetia bacterium]|nr:AMP-binding protein [Planctomycetia bacterium]
MPEAASPWVEKITIGDTLRATARRHPDRPALVFRQFDVRRTYAEFDRDVDQAARALLGLGIGKGEHVAVWATNWPQWV